jgi:hypothetical protein
MERLPPEVLRQACTYLVEAGAAAAAADRLGVAAVASRNFSRANVGSGTPPSWSAAGRVDSTQHGDGRPEVFPACLAGNLRAVCRDWRAAVDGAALWSAALSWRSLDARGARCLADARLATMPAWVTAGATALLLEDTAQLGAGLLSVCARLPSLRSLTLRNCGLANPELVSALRRLGLAASARVKDRGEAQPAPALEILSLSHCYGIADDSVAAAAQLMPRLTRVSLSSCGRLVLPTGSAGDGTVQISRAAAPGTTAPERGPMLTDAALTALAIHCTGLRALCVSGCQFVSDAGVAAVLAACPRLSELDVSKCVMLDGSFLFQLCVPAVAARVVKLNMAGVGSAAHAASACRANALAAFAGQPSLPDVGGSAASAGGDALAASPAFGVLMGTVEATGSARCGSVFPALQQLEIGWCPWLRDDVAAVVAPLLRQSVHLERLSLHACAGLTGAGVRVFRTTLPEPALLRELDIGQIPALQDGEVADVLAGLSGLEELGVSGCSKVGAAAYAAIGRHCPALRRLRSRLAVRVDGAVVQEWISAANALAGRRGAADDSGGYTDALAAACDSEPAERSAARAAAALSPTGRQPQGGAGDSSDPGPGRAAAAVPTAIATLALTHVDWWRAMEVDDDCCELLAGAAPALTHVVLDSVDISLTDAGIVALAAGCPALTHLSLAGCPLSDESLGALSGLRWLTYLDLAQGIEYTPRALAAAVAELPLLETLKLQHCDAVTDAVIDALVQSCPRLHTLTLRGCGTGGDGDGVGDTLLGDVGAVCEAGTWPPGAAQDDGPEDLVDDAGEEPDSRDRAYWTALTPAALHTLGRAVVHGRLTFLGLACVPAFTAAHIVAFLATYGIHPRSVLQTFKCTDGLTVDDLQSFALALCSRLRAEGWPAPELPPQPPALPLEASARHQRYRVLSYLEALVPGVHLEWRFTGAAVA